MKEVILHIGMHKTGTTSIQATLHGFDDGTTRMADIGDSNHSIPITTVFSPNRHRYYIHTRIGRTPEQIDRIADEIRERLKRDLCLQRERLIISGEDISLLEPEGVTQLRDYLLSHVDRVRVLAYVRDPIGFASSAFQQYVSGGKREISAPEPEYRNRFSKFVDAFGRDNVEFVRFDRSELRGGSVVPDFCDRCGIDPASVKERQTNESVPADVTRLLLAMNRRGIPTQGSDRLVRARDQFIWNLITQVEGGSLKLPTDYILSALDRADIEWMEGVSGFALMPEAAATPGDDRSIEEDLGTISGTTLETLQRLAGEIDPAFSKMQDMIGLLNLLFLSVVFSIERAESPSRGEKLRALLSQKKHAA